MTWRQLYTKIINDMHDLGAVSSLPGYETLGIIWAELTINLVYILTRSQIHTITGQPDFSLVNIHTKVNNLSLIDSVRKTSGERVDRLGYNVLTIFDQLFSTVGTPTTFYTIGANIFGLYPVGNDSVDLGFVPYIEVGGLDDTIILREDYMPSLDAILASLMLARLGHIERALEKLKTGLGVLYDIHTRPIH